MSIITEAGLEPLIIPEADSFVVDAEITKVAYRDTSYFGGSASGLTWKQNNYVGDFVFWTVSNPDDKLRSNLRIGIGDIFSGFAAADISSSETFFDKKIQPNEDIAYYDVFNRKLMTFRQRRVDTNDDLKTYSYESILSRMNDTYPPSYMMRAQDLPGNPSQRTAGQWVQHLFEAWREEYDWFDFETVTELHPRIFNGAVYNFVVNSAAFAVIQEEDQEKSMRQIIDEILGTFEGHRLVVTKDNKLKIQPPVWSVAYSSGQVVLDSQDLYTYPIALPQDYSNIINKVTVRSQAYSYVADQPVISPSFVKSEGDSTNDLSDFYPTRTEYDITAEIPITTPLVGGNSITLELSLEYYWVDLKEVQTANVVLTRGKDVLWKRNSVFTTGFLCDAEIETSWRFRWDDVKNVIEVERYYMFYRPPGGLCGQTTKYGCLLMVDAVGQVWQKSNTTFIGSFGTTENYEDLSGLESSQQTFGVREYEISSDFFQLTRAQCVNLAKGTVDALMRPTTRFNLELSIWNQYAGLTPEQIGKKIMLPSGLEGVLSDFVYSDDYSGDTPVVSCVAEITVTEEI